MDEATHEALMSLLEVITKLKQEVADLKAWAIAATETIQNMQETDGCDYLRLP